MKKRCTNCKTEYEGSKCPSCGSTIGEDIGEAYFSEQETVKDDTGER